MGTYRGLDGFLCLGGILTGTPRLAAGYATGASEIAITGAGASLTGIVAVGDQFTIEGETGSPTHAVAGSFYECTGNALGTIALATVQVSATVAVGATVNFVANSVGQVKAFNFSADVEMLDSTVMGTNWRTYHATATLMASWNGGGECLLDYDDTKQAELIDAILASTPSPALDAVLFGTADEHLWYAQGVVSNLAITSDEGSLFTVTFSFTGTGSMRPRWD